MPELRAVVWAGIASFSLGTAAAVAGEERYAVGDGVLIASIDGNWERIDVSDVSRDAVGFQVNGSMVFMFEPYPQRANLKISTGELRVLAQDLRREIVSQGGEAGEDLHEIEGGQVRGYFVQGTTVESRESEYRYVYLGYVVVGDAIPVEFHILWAKGGEAIAKRALNAIRGMRLARD